jgi:hypothetical protein
MEDQEAREIRELRQMIGDSELERLRPTGGGAGVSFPGKDRPGNSFPTAANASQLARKATLQDERRGERDSWDARVFHPTDFATSARRERFMSARMPSASVPFISKRAALESYKREMADHTIMWRQQRAYTQMEWDYYRQQREWELSFSSPAQLTASALAAHDAVAPEPGTPPAALAGEAGQPDAAASVTANAAEASVLEPAATAHFQPDPQRAARKGELQEEEAGARDSPKFRRRGQGVGQGVSQTSRVHERHRPPAGRQRTSRQVRSKWVPPTLGWDASPARAVPYTLRGTRPVTDEPWARDEAINRNAEMEGVGGHRAGTKRGGKKKPAVAIENRPAWDSSKTPYY